MCSVGSACMCEDMCLCVMHVHLSVHEWVCESLSVCASICGVLKLGMQMSTSFSNSLEVQTINRNWIWNLISDSKLNQARSRNHISSFLRTHIRSLMLRIFGNLWKKKKVYVIFCNL